MNYQQNAAVNTAEMASGTSSTEMKVVDEKTFGMVDIKNDFIDALSKLVM